MFCKNCGEKINEQAEICVHCGVRVRNPIDEDKPNWGINLVTLCCMPIVGLIMFFVWQNEKPAAAKSALTFFFLSVGMIILAYLSFFFIGVVLDL